MDERVRRTVTAWVVVVTLLTLPAPAAAAPAADSVAGVGRNAVELVDELWTWLATWFVDSSPRSVSARGGGAIDPDGSESPDPEDGGTVTTQGGGAIDPDG